MVKDKWFARQKNWNLQSDIAFGVVFVLFVIFTVLLWGCGVPANQEDREPVIGTREQPYSVLYAANSSQTRQYAYGVCNDRYRSKCNATTGCANGAACIQPRQPQQTFCLSGPDGIPAGAPPNQRNWKWEMRRLLLDTDGPEWVGIASAQAGFQGVKPEAYEDWAMTEVPCSQAKYEFRNESVSCHTGQCGMDRTGGDTELIDEHFTVTEPALTTLTEKCWTQQGIVNCSIPGVFKRKTFSTNKTLVRIDIDDIRDFAQDAHWEKYGLDCPPGTSSYHTGAAGCYDDYYGSLHFFYEHAARAIVMNTVFAIGFGFSNQHDTNFDTGSLNLMNPRLVFYIGGDGWNASNWLTQWEDCTWRNFAFGDNSEYWQAPSGCLIQ